MRILIWALLVLPAMAFSVTSSVSDANDGGIPLFCPTEGSEEQTILLIDTSDPLDSKGQQRLRQLLEGFMEPASRHYIKTSNELIVYRLDFRNSTAPPSLRICNPGNPADRSWVDNLFSSPRKAEQDWNTFRRLIVQNAFIPNVNVQGIQDYTPLLETLSWVTTKHVPRRGGEKAHKPTRLILFSDMLQNSPIVSHYRGIPSLKEFKELPGYSDVRSDLRDVDVWIFYLNRSGLNKIQTPEHYYWWSYIVDLFGGNLVEQVPL